MFPIRKIITRTEFRLNHLYHHITILHSHKNQTPSKLNTLDHPSKNMFDLFDTCYNPIFVYDQAESTIQKGNTLNVKKCPSSSCYCTFSSFISKYSSSLSSSNSSTPVEKAVSDIETKAVLDVYFHTHWSTFARSGRELLDTLAKVTKSIGQFLVSSSMSYCNNRKGGFTIYWRAERYDTIECKSKC